jgi:hypothetical protein
LLDPAQEVLVRMARTVLLGVLVVAFGAIASIAASDPPDLAGVYSCDGKNPDGSVYHGVVEITKRKDTFRVRWTLADNAQVLGVGIYSNSILAVSYFGGAPAVVVYKLDGDHLVGEWTMGGVDGAVYTETLTKMPAGTAPPAPPRPADRERRRPQEEKNADPDATIKV